MTDRDTAIAGHLRAIADLLDPPKPVEADPPEEPVQARATISTGGVGDLVFDGLSGGDLYEDGVPVITADKGADLILTEVSGPDGAVLFLNPSVVARGQGYTRTLPSFDPAQNQIGNLPITLKPGDCLVLARLIPGAREREPRVAATAEVHVVKSLDGVTGSVSPGAIQPEPERPPPPARVLRASIEDMARNRFGQIPLDGIDAPSSMRTFTRYLDDPCIAAAHLRDPELRRFLGTEGATAKDLFGEEVARAWGNSLLASHLAYPALDIEDHLGRILQIGGNLRVWGQEGGPKQSWSGATNQGLAPVMAFAMDLMGYSGKEIGDAVYRTSTNEARQPRILSREWLDLLVPHWEKDRPKANEAAFSALYRRRLVVSSHRNIVTVPDHHGMTAGRINGCDMVGRGGQRARVKSYREGRVELDGDSPFAAGDPVHFEFEHPAEGTVDFWISSDLPYSPMAAADYRANVAWGPGVMGCWAIGARGGLNRAMAYVRRAEREPDLPSTLIRFVDQKGQPYHLAETVWAARPDLFT